MPVLTTQNAISVILKAEPSAQPQWVPHRRGICGRGRPACCLLAAQGGRPAAHARGHVRARRQQRRRRGRAPVHGRQVQRGEPRRGSRVHIPAGAESAPCPVLYFLYLC